MFKKLFLFSFLLISAVVEAETLFYKKDGSPITPQEHEMLYKIMLETQFPMSLMYGQYADDEIKVMNEKIKVELPDSGIEAAFIPTTLYELFALQFRDPKGQKLCKIGKEFFPKLLKDVEAFKEINMLPFYRHLHLSINNYILKTLKQDNIQLPLTFNKAVQSIKKIDDEEFQALFFSDMERAIAIEYQAYNTNQFVLYRASNLIDDYHSEDLAYNRSRSISFGNSLFGGFLYHLGSCVYHHLRFKKDYGYVVFIDKKQYVHGMLKNMFYIPPIITLLGLMGVGELFHPRTKVINLEKGEIAGLFVEKPELKNLIPYLQIKAEYSGRSTKNTQSNAAIYKRSSPDF